MEPELAKQPSLGRMPSAADYTPIGVSDAFEARLQAIKTRPPQDVEGAAQRPGPWICAFTNKYARYSLSDLKDLDAQLRANCFPDARDHAPTREQVEEWFWDGLASEGEAKILYCSDLDGTAFPQVEMLRT